MQSWLDQVVEMIYRYEGRWGIENFAIWGAVIITLLVLAGIAVESLRLGYSWFSSLVRAFLWSAWLFPLVYCLILQAPLWLTLILSLGLGVGGQDDVQLYLFRAAVPNRQEKSVKRPTFFLNPQNYFI